MEETAGQRKVVGAIWLLAAIVSIGAALVLQPVSDWGTFGIILAILVAILVIGYLVSDWSNWTAQDALTIGVWVAIGAMFAEGLVITSKAR